MLPASSLHLSKNKVKSRKDLCDKTSKSEMKGGLCGFLLLPFIDLLLTYIWYFIYVTHHMLQSLETAVE